MWQQIDENARDNGTMHEGPKKKGKKSSMLS